MEGGRGERRFCRIKFFNKANSKYCPQGKIFSRLQILMGKQIIMLRGGQSFPGLSSVTPLI